MIINRASGLNTYFPRVNQRFLLATSTKIDVSGVKVPDNINDKYFARYDQSLFRDVMNNFA